MKAPVVLRWIHRRDLNTNAALEFVTEAMDLPGVKVSCVTTDTWGQTLVLWVGEDWTKLPEALVKAEDNARRASQGLRLR